MKDYHCAGWFAFRGCPPEMPYQATPPELWLFLLRADAVEAAIQEEQMRGAGKDD